MVDAAINHTAVEVNAPEGRPSDYFGKITLADLALPDQAGNDYVI